MDLRTDIRDGFAVIALSGRLTATGAPLLRKAVNDLVAGGDSRIVIDMTDLQFVDSSGLGALVGGLKSCLLYTSPSPRDRQKSRMPSSA